MKKNLLIITLSLLASQACFGMEEDGNLLDLLLAPQDPHAIQNGNQGNAGDQYDCWFAANSDGSSGENRSSNALNENNNAADDNHYSPPSSYAFDYSGETASEGPRRPKTSTKKKASYKKVSQNGSQEGSN